MVLAVHSGRNLLFAPGAYHVDRGDSKQFAPDLTWHGEQGARMTVVLAHWG